MTKIRATVKYIKLGTGFWSIEDSKGGKYEIINMPHQLRVDGKKFDVWIKPRPDLSTTNMYGTPAEITGFST